MHTSIARTDLNNKYKNNKNNKKIKNKNGIYF